MTFEQINKIDTNISSFEYIKTLSEQKWRNITLNECWGFQIQENSIWNSGLSEKELNEFQKQMGFEFPESLKNFYRTMNGLNKLGINISGDLNTQNPTYRPTFYSYPDDLELMKEQINWILDSNEINIQDIKKGKAPFIFPYFGHRFLIIDSNEQVLSMHGDDIIPWADNLAKGILKDILELYDGEFSINEFKPIKYWLE